MNKVIDNKVKKQMVELDSSDRELNVFKKIKFTDIKTGQYFFVSFISKGQGQIVSDIYSN
jgi:hypothetical protein